MVSSRMKLVYGWDSGTADPPHIHRLWQQICKILQVTASRGWISIKSHIPKQGAGRWACVLKKGHGT